MNASSNFKSRKENKLFYTFLRNEISMKQQIFLAISVLVPIKIGHNYEYNDILEYIYCLTSHIVEYG